MYTVTLGNRTPLPQTKFQLVERVAVVKGTRSTHKGLVQSAEAFMFVARYKPVNCVKVLSRMLTRFVDKESLKPLKVLTGMLTSSTG